MARITITLSSKQDKITRKSPLLFRFVGGRDFIFRVKSGLYIAPNRWNADKEEAIEPRLDTPEKKEIVRLNKQLTSWKIQCKLPPKTKAILPPCAKIILPP